MGEELKKAPSPVKYTDIFNDAFPYYLSIGMTYEQFWESDCELTVYYRQAEKIRQSKRNEEMWLQAMYIYDAIGRLAPIMNAFAKKGTKAEPYMSCPYPISKEQLETFKEEKAQSEAKKFAALMSAKFSHLPDKKEAANGT